MTLFDICSQKARAETQEIDDSHGLLMGSCVTGSIKAILKKLDKY